jgi:hypothetical protein
MVDFKGSHYPKEVILYAVFFYVRYAVSYRDLEEIMAERGVAVDHPTLNRWVVKYSPLIACQARRRKFATSHSWRMDETYIQVKGKWTYFYRAVGMRDTPASALRPEICAGYNRFRIGKCAEFRIMDVAGLCRKFSQNLQYGLSLDTLMRRAQRIAEMQIGHWLKVAACGSCEPPRCHPVSLTQTERI